MTQDACTNRRHSLSRPPPVRRDRPLKNHGCMACPKGRKDECAYREAYGCTADVRDVGQELGHCAVERLWRDEARDKTVSALAGLPFWMRSRADELSELLLDAHLYLRRAHTWAWLTFNRPSTEGGYSMGDPEFLRAAFRYRLEGSSYPSCEPRIARLRST